MARIFYSLAGEGRGHAVRARSLVSALEPRHDITLFASDQAYEFLEPFYDHRGMLQRLPGLRFHYVRERLSLLRSLCASFSFLGQMREWRQRLGALIAKEKPDLVIVDFEPLLPRAAADHGVPMISFDHQHVFRYGDFRGFPWRLRLLAKLLGMAARLVCPKANLTIVTSFLRPALHPSARHVVAVGPILRPEVVRLQPTCGEHTLAYLRPRASRGVVELLRQLKQKVIVYGLSSHGTEGSLEFRPIHEERFLHDLAHARAVISAAGNQLLGEALFLGKPYYAIYERHHHEQELNAYVLQQSGRGRASRIDRLTLDDLMAFFGELERYRSAPRDPSNGVEDAVSAIATLLA